MDSSQYKETYRRDMIRWGESVRDKDPDYFCRLSAAGADQVVAVWLVCDARRPTDTSYFNRVYSSRTLSVRVEASDGVRAERGWVFTRDIDDAPSECALDEYSVDVTISNGGGEESLTQQLKQLQVLVQEKISLHVPAGQGLQ